MSVSLADAVYRGWVELDNEVPPPLVHGAREVLETLFLNSALLTVLTSRHRDELSRPLAYHQLEKNFSLVQTADCGESHKPDPRVFQWTFGILAPTLQ